MLKNPKILLAILVISIVLIVLLFVAWIVKIREYNNLKNSDSELKKFRGYKEEVEQLKHDLLTSLPDGMLRISAIWVDLHKYLEVLETDYRHHGRDRLRAKVWRSPEVNYFRNLAQENRVLTHRLEIAESKYVMALTVLREKYGEDALDVEWDYYLRAIKKIREDQDREYENKIAQLEDRITKLQKEENKIKSRLKEYHENCELIDFNKNRKEANRARREELNYTLTVKELESKRLAALESDLILKRQSVDKLRGDVELAVRGLNERIEVAKEKMLEANDVPTILEKIASAWADYKYLIWDKAIVHLTQKKRPITFEKAEDYRKQLKEYKDDIFVKYKETQYKYDYLLALFPELHEYIDGEAIREDTVVTKEETEDRRIGYLSKEEWRELNETQKSQLALDRYNERRKRTNAQVGRDYEEYIAHLFRVKLKGCDVSMFGEQKGLNDLGRDLIVKHRGKVYIVQCKRWSTEKVIREKHIMQLFGSTIEYCWENRKKGLPPLEMVGKSVIPVFVATTDLSDTAKQFTERLGVVFVREEIGDYPQIKCNVGNDGERIYHLPFDQQYNRVIIEPMKKEFMAWTVEEAEQKGFRRAKKFYYD